MLLALLTGSLPAADGVRAAPAGGSPPSAERSATAAPAAATLDDLRAAASRGDAQAQYDLGVALDCGRGVKRNRAQALEWLRKAADQDHVAAQSVLGWKYMTGQGVRRDDAAAFAWLRRAAERDDTSAQNNLGILYAQGRGTRPTQPGCQVVPARRRKGAVDARRNLDALLAGHYRELGRGSAPPLPRT
jgi:TPR repeat protein